MKPTRFLLPVIAACVLVMRVDGATMQLPSLTSSPGQAVSATLTVNSGTEALGDYQLTVSFNTNVLQFVSVTGGSGEFSAAPGTVNSTVPGQVSYVHQQTISLTSPTGTVVASHVNFNVIGTPGSSSALAISGESADNTDGLPIPVTGTTDGSVDIVASGELLVNPGNLMFGQVSTGETSSLQFFVINTGGQSVTGTAAATLPYVIDTGSPYILGPGQTGAVTVAFEPVTAGTFNSSVIFDSTGGVSTNPVSGTGVVPGHVSVSPATLDFGSVATGAASQAVFTVSNTGGGTLSNGVATVSGAPFSVVAGSPFSVPPSGSTNVTVRFAPVSVGAFNGTITFSTTNGGSATNAVSGTGAIVPVASFTATPTNGPAPLTVTFTDTSSGTISARQWNFGDGTTSNTALTSVMHTYNAAGNFTAQLTVTGPVGSDSASRLITAVNPPQLVVTPASRDYGAAVVGSTNAQQFSVVNTGDLLLTGSVSANAPFLVTGGTSLNVAAHQTQQVTVAFAPTTAGTFNGTVAFTSNGGSSSNSVTGVGLVGGQLGVSPASLNFGPRLTGSTTQGVFTVTNFGGVLVSNGTATVTGGPFSIVSGSTFTLAAGGSTNVVVQFAPISQGSFTNAVVFSSANGGSSTNSVTGTGGTIPSANFNASPTNGVVPLVVTFTDTSSGTITSRFWSFGDGATTNTLATGFTHSYAVAGTYSVQLIVSGPFGVSTNSKPNLIVAVNAAHLSVSPASQDFGPVPVGDTNTLNFVVANDGDLPLNGTATVPAPFVVVSGSPYSLAGGATGTVMVSFRPVSAGTFNTNVIFSSNGGASTNPVVGLGITPGQISVSPSSFDYGTIGVNSSTQALFTVSNFGSTTVNGGTATVIGGPFAVVSGSTFNVPAGGSVNVIVSFTPISVGAFTNAVVFNSTNGGSSTNALTGAASLLPVANFSATPLEGTAPLMVQFTNESTGTIDGRLWTFGDGTTSSNSNPSHEYDVAGTFTVSLTVFGPAGTNTITKTNLITVMDSNPSPLAGTFYGLSVDDPPTFENSGLVVIKLATSREFKGTFQQGKVKTKFTGTFDVSGNVTTTVARAGLPVMTMALHLDGSGTDQITGTVGDGSFTGSVLANRMLDKTSPPSPLAGKQFTFLLPADTTNTTQTVPLGDGFGTVSIKAPGSVALAGYTGDGQKIKQKAFISKFGTWPMYVPLYKGVGAMFGWVTHTNVVGVSDFDAPLHWHKPPAPGTPFLPGGFADDIFMVGAEYVPPQPGHTVLTVSNNLDNARIMFGDGNLPTSIITHVTVTPANAVLSTNLTVKITTTTGLFKGKFKHPTSGASVPFQGAFLQKQNFGSGFFLGTNQAGFVTFEPTP